MNNIKKYATGKILIKPFVNYDSLKTGENLGIENYDMAIMPNTVQRESIAKILDGNQEVYITGLNENSSTVRSILDPETKKARILEIRTVVSYLEKTGNFKNVDPEDPNFWEKIEMFHPLNDETWKKFSFTFDNKVLELKPFEKIEDLILFYAIKENGISLVANSKDDAYNTNKKWYLSIETLESEKSISKIKNKNVCLGLITQMYNKTPEKLFLFVKNLDPNATQYKKTISNNTLYEKLDDYINGKLNDRDIEYCVNKFKQINELPPKDLKVRAMVVDAIYLGLITMNSSGSFIWRSDNTSIGRNIEEVVTNVLNPLNEPVLSKLISSVESYWNN